jgi:hypothetical protein
MFPAPVRPSPLVSAPDLRRPNLKNVKQRTGESLELFFQFSPDAQGFSEIRSESTDPLGVTINFQPQP